MNIWSKGSYSTDDLHPKHESVHPFMLTQIALHHKTLQWGIKEKFKQVEFIQSGVSFQVVTSELQ